MGKYPRRTIALGPPYDDGTVPGEPPTVLAQLAQQVRDLPMPGLRVKAGDTGTVVNITTDGEQFRRDVLALIEVASSDKGPEADPGWPPQGS